jgi:hypothetical protein
VVDVSGKGIAAALLTASVEALAAGFLEVGLLPEEVCDRVCRRLFERTPPEKYATAFLATLEPGAGRFGFGIPLNSREWWPFYTKAAELGVPVVFQTGHSAEFMPSACGQPILLDDIAIWFPELKLVGAHTGWPWVEELIAMAWKHPNVYIATSGHAPKYWDPKLVRFLNARNRGIGKVMWGTDYPLILHEESLAQVADLDLKPEALAALLHDTAAKVFGLPPRPTEPTAEPSAATV